MASTGIHGATERFVIDGLAHDTIVRAAPGGLQDGPWPPAHGFRDIEAYWRDSRPFEAEQAERRAIFNAAMAAHDAREAARREARWAREGDA